MNLQVQDCAYVLGFDTGSKAGRTSDKCGRTIFRELWIGCPASLVSEVDRHKGEDWLAWRTVRLRRCTKWGSPRLVSRCEYKQSKEDCQ